MRVARGADQHDFLALGQLKVRVGEWLPAGRQVAEHIRDHAERPVEVRSPRDHVLILVVDRASPPGAVLQHYGAEVEPAFRLLAARRDGTPKQYPPVELGGNYRHGILVMFERFLEQGAQAY